MWLQRVLFNVQRRLLGADDEAVDLENAPESVSERPSGAPDRVQLFQQRLRELDRRLALLR